MSLTTVTIPVPNTEGAESAWVSSPLVSVSGVSLRGSFEPGDRFTVYGSSVNTGAVGSGVGISAVTVTASGDLSFTVPPRNWMTFRYLGIVRGGGDGIGITLSIDGDDDSAAVVIVGVVVTAAKPRLVPSVHLAPGALPGAGGWSTQAALDLGDGNASYPVRLGFQVSYTGAAAGAGVKFRVLKSLDTDPPVWVEAALDATITPVPATNEGLQHEYTQGVLRPIVGAAADNFPVDVDSQGGWRYWLCQLAEYGAPGTPGSAAIIVSGSF